MGSPDWEMLFPVENISVPPATSLIRYCRHLPHKSLSRLRLSVFLISNILWSL